MFRIFSLLFVRILYTEPFYEQVFAVAGNVFYVARREHCFYLQYGILDT